MIVITWLREQRHIRKERVASRRKSEIGFENETVMKAKGGEKADCRLLLVIYPCQSAQTLNQTFYRINFLLYCCWLRSSAEV